MIPLEFFYINAARIFLEECKWDEAKKECDAVLSMENPVFCKEEAHLIKFLAEYKITEIIQLCVIGESFFENEDYRWLLSKGSIWIRNELKEAIESRKQFILHQSTKTKKRNQKIKRRKIK